MNPLGVTKPDGNVQFALGAVLVMEVLDDVHGFWKRRCQLVPCRAVQCSAVQCPLYLYYSYICGWVGCTSWREPLTPDVGRESASAGINKVLSWWGFGHSRSKEQESNENNKRIYSVVNGIGCSRAVADRI